MRDLILVMLLFFSIPVFGQAVVEPRLFDQRGNVSCEQLLALSDVFSQTLSKDASSRGLVVIHPDEDSRRSAEGRLMRVSAELQRLNMAEKVSFLLADDKNSQIAFWIIPPGGVEPDIPGIKWVEPTYDLRRPFILGYEDEIGICSTFVPGVYAELLKQHPLARGHLVIYGSSKYDRKMFAKQWLQTFTVDFGLSKNRFRVYFIRQKGLTAAEFWFVPGNS